MLNIRIQIIVALAIAISIIVIVNMIRKNQLELKYALAWIFLGGGILLVDCFPQLMTKVARLIGIDAPVNMLFFLGFCFSLVLIFVLTIAVSRLSKKVKQLAQETALYEKTVSDKIAKGDSIK